MTRQEWLAWRKQGIGSSDAPMIMGVSKFGTIVDLYEDKISPVAEEDTSNSFIKDMGNDLEPRVRELFGFLDGQEYEVALIQMEEFPFVLVSLDGRSVENPKRIIEIKLLGKEDYEKAQKGIVPEQYVPQVQHQLLGTQAEVCVFLGYPHAEFMKNRREALNADFLVQIEVYPDKDYQAQLLEAEMKFWTQNVMKKKPPVASADDYVMLKGQARALNKWKKLKAKADEIGEQLDAAREELIALAEKQGHPKYQSNGVRMRKEARQGNVDYKKIPAVKAMSKEDLEQYRGKGSSSWKIEIHDDEGN